MIEYENNKQKNYICELEEVFTEMNEKYAKAVEILEEYGQNHIITFLESLTNIEKEKLVNQILTLDFKKILKLYKKTKSRMAQKENKLEPIEYIIKDNIEKKEKEELEKIGSQIIQDGEYAIITMAGGQGTRLGFNGPKGAFLIDVEPNTKSLFEIVSDKLKSMNKKYQTVVHWYIMTSKENNNETVAFFEENEYFAYPEDYIQFFPQTELPLIDIDGKLLIGKDYLIKEASDGNGQIFKSMLQNDILKDMEQKGIKWIFINGIDNILADISDTLLLGLTIKQNNLIGAKSVVKANPDEKVGVYCKINGKVGIVEYTELSKTLAKKKDKNGNLLYGQANINCNLFNIKAIQKVSSKELPYHNAFKANCYLNENKELITPSEPNAFKFESFMFDSFKYFNDITLLQGKREEDFAPIKNKEGVDSPKTAIELYNKCKK